MPGIESQEPRPKGRKSKDSSHYPGIETVEASSRKKYQSYMQEARKVIEYPTMPQTILNNASILEEAYAKAKLSE